MSEHYTRNTVSAAHWCGKCQKRTQHRIDDRRIGPCLECIAKLEAQHAVSTRCADCYFITCPCAGPGICKCSCHLPKPDAAIQQELFRV
jgi:hypothetical protein